MVSATVSGKSLISTTKALPLELRFHFNLQALWWKSIRYIYYTLTKKFKDVEGNHNNLVSLSICTWFLQFELDFSACKIQVWNIKLAKSKIPVRVVKNVISKWTKMEFPRFLSLWFTAVAAVNPPDQKLEDHQNILP